MINRKSKILIAMSGGVDSSVAAALLVRAGSDVTGMYAVNFEGEIKSGESCWRGDYQDALRVAAKLGIKLLRWDFTREYKRDVLDYMYQEYRAGRTPNPDVLCNKFVKFGAWLDRAKKEGFDFIATGHYAQVKTVGRRVELLEPKDKNKDQTYFLHQLSQEQLKHTMFPLGKYTKPQVRALAKKFDLPTADKEESMGICFVGEVPMKEFLQKEIKPNPGKIILSPSAKRGRGGVGEVGEHSGLPFYTIGERIGLSTSAKRGRGGVVSSTPLYVVEKNIKTNDLIVGEENDPALFKKEIAVENTNWISGQPPKFPLKCMVRLRHRAPLQTCVVTRHSDRPSDEAGSGEIPFTVQFTKPQRALTPGQFAVFYKGGICLGGGVIN